MESSPMICETCHGRRFVDAGGTVPCPDCGGCGFAHCCEGERPTSGAGEKEETHERDIEQTARREDDDEQRS